MAMDRSRTVTTGLRHQCPLVANSLISLAISSAKSPRKSSTPSLQFQLMECSYLPLPEMLSSLSLNRFLLDLTQSHLSPIPSVIHQLLLDGPPYPPILAKLPSLSLFFPQDGETIFIDLLIRARPKWILERLELGRWREAVWKKAFERRFLPSWKRFKGDGDSWRAFFLR